MLKILKIFLLDLFFPKKCLGCKKDGTYICQSCIDKVEISPNNTCPFCDRPVPNTLICQKCREYHYLNRLIWAVPYHNPLIKGLIGIFKYHYVKELAKPLAQLLIRSIENKSTFTRLSLVNLFVIVPIPLHRRKLRERGFNQAELLAKEIAEHFLLPVENEILMRKKYTSPQARTKDHKVRKEMLKDAFEISKKFIKKCLEKNQNLLKDRIVILVDDVATTGATLSEAAKVLKRAGAKEIWGLVVAKG